jgi:uncharacterized membrane protein YozB (DUF420 family)
MTIEDLPALNASLNAAVTVIILAGRSFAKRHSVKAHRACMVTAVGLSVIFLASYVTYHSLHGITTFPGTGWPRSLYFGILFSHWPLAAALLPLIGVALRHAIRGDIEKHRRIVRWVFPIWLYVSVTGVVIYLMLNRVRW